MPDIAVNSRIVGISGQVSIRVTVVMAKPGHGEGQAILIAAFGDEVEIAAR
jgi:hypothetical protein